MKIKSLTLSRYVVFGIIANVLGYLLYSGLTFTDLLSSERQRLVASALILFPFVFFVNRKYVFKSSNKPWSDFARYSVIYLAAIVYGLVGLTISLMFIFNPYLAQAVSSVAVLGTTFLLNNYWSFKQATREVPN
jgi:putative flippase GtrA